MSKLCTRDRITKWEIWCPIDSIYDQIIGFVDGKKLAAVTDQSRAKGMAFLASTYDHNLFDNLRVGPLPAEGQAE